MFEYMARVFWKKECVLSAGMEAGISFRGFRKKIIMKKLSQKAEAGRDLTVDAGCF